MRKTENIINRTGINKTECKKTGHSKENKIPGVKCTPKIELYLSNFKGALHWWNGSLFFLIIILGITLGIFAGCKNIFVPEPPATPEAAGPGGGITVSLRLFTGSARSVMPRMEDITWEITASQGDITISVANGEYPEFKIYFPSKGEWTIEVKGKSGTEPSAKEIFTGIKKMEITGSTTSISIPLTPGSGMKDEGATGNLNLTIKPENVNSMSLKYRIDGSEEWESPVSFGEEDYTISGGPLFVGQHTLDLYFSSNSDKGKFYFCTVAVNIWPGMTSDQWIKTNGEEYINNKGEFAITEDMVDKFVKTMGSVVFVDATVDADTPATGSFFAPVNSVSTAVDILRQANPDGNYSGTIMVSEATTIEDEIEVKNGETLTIKGTGTGASITNGKGRVFNITSGGSLTLEENITLTGTVTGGKGGAVYVAGGTFTMEDGSKIIGSSASFGGGVYIAGGTFIMNGTAILQGNTATTHGGGVHILSGGTFTMNGGTIGGTAQNTANYGGGVFVSGGEFIMNDGYVSGNSATLSGGGVFVNAGNFTMTGGTIGGTTANTATQNGGGVYVGVNTGTGEKGSFTMGGGTITGNTATQKGGGVYVSSTGSFTLGSSRAASSPVISENTKTGDSTNNVYLDNTYLVIGGKLAEASGNVGITMATPGEEFTLEWSSSGLSDTTFFFSDDTKRTVALSGSELSLNLVHVEGGSCILNGQNVTISSFWISPYEVTQAEFESIMEENSNGITPDFYHKDDTLESEEDQKRRPADRVRWYEAIVYCNLLSIKEGLTPCYTIKGSTTPADWGERPDSNVHDNYYDWNSVTCNFDDNGYRLPTEAEWEYAARGGKTGITDGSWNNTYSGSDTINDVAWYSSNSDSKTHEVGKMQANALGLYDMSGNLKELCWNRKSEDNDSRVMRGGYYSSAEGDCKVTAFDSNLPISQGPDQGFRVVRSIR